MARRASPILLLLLLLSALPARALADRGAWTVRQGDALSLLAHRFGVSVDNLRDWNELNGDRIYVGQELRLSRHESPRRGGYTVASGDTASEIAFRFGIAVDDLLTWNPDLDPDRIREGQVLRIGTERRRVDYRVRQGDTLSAIAARYEVRVDDLVRWNRRLRGRDQVRSDQRLVVYTERPESRSEAVGSPNDGSLLHAVRLRRHPGYVIRDRGKVWATDETAASIVSGFDAVRRRFGAGPRPRVHDISARQGGAMYGHRSHQNGRDADLSYYQHRCDAEQGCLMRRLNPQDLDTARQWALLHAWLAAGQAEAIFVDYHLQAPLYEQARSEGATPEQLHRWFQYPRGRTFPLGIIRHFPQHRDHLHVRFRCHDTDEECR